MLNWFKHLALSFFLVWLFYFPALAQQVELLSKQQTPQPPLKPILNAPSLQIPAMPAYKTTVKDLGYESVDDLLKQSIQTQSKITSVAFDGSGMLASGSEDGTVQLWRVDSGELVNTLEAQSPVSSVAFDGSGLLASGSEDGTVKLWRVGSGELVNTLEAQSPVRSVAFDRLGILASGSGDGTVKLWQVSSGVRLHTLQAHEYWVNSIAFDGSGVLATGGEDKTVKLWQVSSGALLRTLQAHEDRVTSVAFDRLGVLATGAYDNTVKLWQVSSGALLNTLQAQNSVLSVAFDGSGLLASGSFDGAVQLWRVGGGELVNTLQGQNQVTSVAFDGSGLLASGSEDGTVKLWQMSSGAPLTNLHAQSGVMSVAFDGSGLLASGSEDGTVKLWQVSSGALLNTLQAQSSVLSVAFDGSGLLASGSGDGTVKLWQVSSGELLRTLQAHEDQVMAVAFDGSGVLATGGLDKTVNLWHASSGTLLKTLEGLGPVMSVAFDGMGVLAVGAGSDAVELWKVKSSMLLNTLETQQDGVVSVALDSLGLLATGSFDGTVKLWRVKKSMLLNTFQAHEEQVASVAFNSSGLLATGALDGTVKLWEVKSGGLLNTLQAQSSVRSVVFDSSGLVATGAFDGTVKLWNAKTGELKQILLATGQGAWANIHADGTVLRADASKILRSRSILAKGEYTVEKPETDQDYQPTGKILKEQQTYQSVKWSYLSFPSSQTPSLVLSLDKTLVDASAANANLFMVQLTNTSAEPIFHPKILQTTSADGSLKIIPAEYLPTYPQTEAIYSSSTLIPAGKTIKLAARVIGNTPKPVASGEYEIPVTVEVSGGQTKTVPHKVNYQTPDVQVVSSDFSRDTNTLSIQLKNQGTLALPKADFYLKDAEGKLNLPRQTLEGITAQTDAPPLAFTLPKDLPQEQLDKLQLEIRPMRPPLYTQWAIPITLTVMPMHTQLGLAALALALLGFTVFYFRRYRHPLVLELGEKPQQLRSLPLEQLPEAQQRLKQTGRLNTVLENAEISSQSLQKAIDFTGLNVEQKAWYLAERLGGSLEETPPNLPLSGEELAPSLDKGRAGVGLDLYTLKLPHNFPLNVNRVLLYFPIAPAEDAINALHAIPQAEGRITLIIGQDAAYQRKLLNTTQDRSNKYVAPQSKQITELLLSPDAEPVFAKILAEQLALQQLSPYQIGGGVNKEAIFFGRRELIAQIINRDPANYLIVGGRQMGKSSLLKALERRYAENAQVRVYYQTLSNETLIPRLAAALDLPETESAQAFAQALEAQLKAQGKRYIFLIDEADLFIAHEQTQGYPILSVFRRLSEQGQCSFILAGFWQLYQHAVLDYQSPLRNFGEVLEVAALEQDACEQLATQPMQTLNLSYANPSLVANMIAQCGQRANLIAYVCHQVIQQLDASQRVIEAGDIHRVLEGRDLQKRLAGWSVGIGEQEQAYDRLVVYSTIQKDSFTIGELMQELEQQGVHFDSAELERALSRLELAFVLKKIQNRYSYCVPLFVEHMREDEVEVKRIRELKAWG